MTSSAPTERAIRHAASLHRQSSIFSGACDGRVGVVTLESPGAQEPAHVRVLCGAARPVPRAGRGDRGPRHRHHRRGRKLLLRRRRARDHRSATQRTRHGLARLHAHDRRSGQGDARLPAAHRRGGRRGMRRRRRDSRHGLGLSPGHAARQNRLPVHAGRARGMRHGRLRACCRGSSARAARRSCCTPAAPCRPRKALAWGFFNRLIAPEARAGGARRPRRARSPGPDVRARHDQEDAARRSGICPSMRPSTPKPKRRPSACRRRISAALTAPSRRSNSRDSRGIDWPIARASSTGHSSATAPRAREPSQ